MSLSDYFAQMTELIYGEHLTAVNATPSTCDKATNLTLSQLEHADPSQKCRVLHFLAEKQLIALDAPKVVLCGANLDSADLHGISLRLSNLSRTRWPDADLSGADLFGCNLYAADFQSLDTIRINLSGVNPGTARTNFSCVNPDTARRTNLSGVNLEKSDLRHTQLQKVDATHATFMAAEMDAANLQAADISFANLQWAQLPYAKLTGCNAKESDFSRAMLRSAHLELINAQKAQFVGANLILADLTSADLSEANLTRADLTDAKLDDTDLTGANLTGAKATAVTLQTARLNEKTILPNGQKYDPQRPLPDQLS